MRITSQVTPKMEAAVPLFQKGRYQMKVLKLKTISCQAKTLTMQSRKTNFYQLLSLSSENVGLDEIKKAYRIKALQYHPDVSPLSTKEESTRRFIELGEAYETLADPISRRLYDCELGLVDSVGCGNRRASFPREIWERQLSGLRRRSNYRMEKQKGEYV